ncbi:MAG: CocE/NonD family hydrolase [Elainellaceae cyanobacterium]
MLPVRKETQSLLTSDGTRLDADIYVPDVAGNFPVLLMRQPYGRAIASTVVYAHPRWYAAQGYIVVIQDVRGRGSSEGEFDLFAHEVSDGGETVAWAAALSQSTGDVGMYGFSYQGMTQLFAAAAQPPALKTLCPAMVAYDLRNDWVYEGDAFCLQASYGWAIQLAAETARRQGHRDAYRSLYTAARTPLSADPVCARSALLNQLAPESFYHDWLNPPSEDYWQQRSPQHYIAAIAQMDLPMLHIGGWYDTYMRGTLRLYQDIVSRCSQPQHLWIGPWPHIPWGRRVGDLDFGPEAVSPIDRLQLRWFDQLLKGKASGILKDEPVRLFDMGRNRWRSHPQFPSSEPIAYWLTSDGLAGISEASGALTLQQPSTPATDIIVHDPWRPVPTIGGHAVFPAGPFDRSAVDSRADVLTYTLRLEASLTITGVAIAHLCCQADAPSFDICTVLSDVHPDGKVYPIAQGYRRVEDHSRQVIEVTLQPTSAYVAAGHQLRLSVSGACFPAYPVNPGTGEALAEGRLMEARVVTISVDVEGQSWVALPVVAESGESVVRSQG